MAENPFICESKNCDDDASFFVYERYDDGAGMAVESEVTLCRECTKENASPSHLDDAYPNYEFKIDPVPEAFGMTTL